GRGTGRPVGQVAGHVGWRRDGAGLRTRSCSLVGSAGEKRDPDGKEWGPRPLRSDSRAARAHRSGGRSPSRLTTDAAESAASHDHAEDTAFVASRPERQVLAPYSSIAPPIERRCWRKP